MTLETVRVLIADDHAEFRAAMKLLLVSHPGIEVVGEARDASKQSGRPGDRAGPYPDGSEESL